MLVRDVMQRDVAMIGPDASLALAARTMRDQDIGCLPVIEHGQLIGMISDRDIVVRGMAGARNRYRDVVRDVMSTRALTCAAEDSVDQARDPHGDKSDQELARARSPQACSRPHIATGHQWTGWQVQAPSGDLLQAARDEFGSCPQRRARDGLSVARDQEGRHRTCSGRQIRARPRARLLEGGSRPL
jgi:CBS domain protein